MPKRGELYTAMVNGSSSDALMLTCKHLYENTIPIMEDDWIDFSALIGKTPEFPYGTLWNTINKSILACIDAEEVDAKEIMMCTVKLMLLYKRCDLNYQPLTLPLLRQKVIHLFPDKATLTPAGLSKYMQIFSILNDIKQSSDSSESDISLFCQRILAGLSKVMKEGKHDELRYCLEYLCKKKIVIPLPTLFPCPNMEEAERGEIIWFLWGTLLCYYGDKNGAYNEVIKDIVYTNYSLFVANWKKCSNKDRLGLLWGVPYTLNTTVALEWTYTEKLIIDKLEENGVEIWRSFLLEQETIKAQQHAQQMSQQQSKSKNKSKNGKNGKNTNVNQELVQNILNTEEQYDILSSYIPRKNTYDEEDDDDEDSNEKLHAKMINNNLQKIQHNQQYEELNNKIKNAAIYDTQLDKLEQTIPFVKTLYLDKSNKYNSSGSSSSSSSSKTRKSKKSQNNENIKTQLDNTDLLIKRFDAKYYVND